MAVPLRILVLAGGRSARQVAAILAFGRRFRKSAASLTLLTTAATAWNSGVRQKIWSPGGSTTAASGRSCAAGLRIDADRVTIRRLANASDDAPVHGAGCPPPLVRETGLLMDEEGRRPWTNA